MFGDAPNYRPTSFAEAIVAQRLGVNNDNKVEGSVADMLQTDNQKDRIAIMESIHELKAKHSLSDEDIEWIKNGNRTGRR